jgi:hypothetical protein
LWEDIIKMDFEGVLSGMRLFELSIGGL